MRPNIDITACRHIRDLKRTSHRLRHLLFAHRVAGILSTEPFKTYVEYCLRENSSFWWVYCSRWLILYNYWLLLATCLILFPRRTTGNICLKSPANSTGLPPNGSADPMMSLSKRSTTVNCRPGDMGASSQTISEASRILCARKNCMVMLEVDCSVSVPNGNPKVECTVMPPSMRDAAIPVYATLNTVRCLLRSDDIKHSYKVVFPVPPGPST